MNDLTIREENNSLQLQTLNDQLMFAETVAKSGITPAGLKTPEQVFVAIQWGRELGLTPMVSLNNVAVVNGKPSLSTDIMHSLVRNNPEYAGTEWVEKNDKVAECIVYRQTKTYREEYRSKYTIEDAERAGLVNKDNWKKYPERMLMHRALSFALRDAFPDVLSGVYSTDELKDIEPEVNIRNITPPEEEVASDDFDVAETVKAASTPGDFD